MKASEFFRKLTGLYLWGNLFAMAFVVVLLIVGVWFGIGLYTHHGEGMPIPNFKHLRMADAKRLAEDAKLAIVVNDTGYVKGLPADCVLEQSLPAGVKVKAGRLIFVTINAPHTPTIALPDIIDNSSLREAMAKLSAMGFLLGMPEYIAGEKDWVYGITVKGRQVAAGDRIAIDDSLIIQVGNGLIGSADSIDFVDPVYPDEGLFEEDGSVDEFEEVTAPPGEEAQTTPQKAPNYTEKKPQ